MRLSTSARNGDVKPDEQQGPDDRCEAHDLADAGDSLAWLHVYSDSVWDSVLRGDRK